MILFEITYPKAQIRKVQEGRMSEAELDCIQKSRTT